MSYNNPHEQKAYGSPQPQYSPQVQGYPSPPQPGAYQQQPQEYHQQQPVYQQDQSGYQHHQQQQQQPQHPPEQHIQHQKQPQPQAPMAEKGSGGHQNANGEREWQNGMCGCFDDMGICCKAYWCPCMTYSSIQWRIRHNGDMNGYSNCNGPCVGWTALTYFGCQWVLSMIQRGDARAKFNLAGSGCGDCTRHYWCSCCSLIQEEKETRLMCEQGVNQGGYQAGGGMNYAPQK